MNAIQNILLSEKKEDVTCVTETDQLESTAMLEKSKRKQNLRWFGKDRAEGNDPQPEICQGKLSFIQRAKKAWDEVLRTTKN